MLDINDFDILVLPGLPNSGPEHWQAHWEAAFPNIRRVEQDNWDEPVYSEWSLRLTEAGQFISAIRCGADAPA